MVIDERRWRANLYFLSIGPWSGWWPLLRICPILGPVHRWGQVGWWTFRWPLTWMLRGLDRRRGGLICLALWSILRQRLLGLRWRWGCGRNIAIIWLGGLMCLHHLLGLGRPLHRSWAREDEYRSDQCQHGTHDGQVVSVRGAPCHRYDPEAPSIYVRLSRE